jgi:hypothetical protein
MLSPLEFVMNSEVVSAHHRKLDATVTSETPLHFYGKMTITPCLGTNPRNG